jgi:hypothetical protein
MELNNTPVLLRSLEAKYGISDQTLNNRLNHLRIKTFKQPGDKRKSYIYQYQVEILDALHEHLKSGKVMAEFNYNYADMETVVEYKTERVGESIDIPIDDIIPSNQDFLMAVASQFNRPHPDEKLRRLEEHAVNRWERTKEELLEILDMPQLPRQAYGFKFKKSSGVWYKIEKKQP